MVNSAEINIVPGKKWKKRSLIFALWTFLGFFFVGQAYILSTLYNRPFDIVQGLIYQMARVYSWAILTPFIIWLGRRYRIEWKAWHKSVPLHIVAALMIVPLYVALAWSTDLVASWLIRHQEIQATVIQYLPLRIRAGFLDGLFNYWLILAISYSFDYYKQFREQKLLASELETKLTEARLQTLKMQLHPHFLFNTLHAISSLMEDDIKAAQRMIARLSELLRMTLENNTMQEVSLQQELEILSKYLEIEQIRFQDRLTAQYSIEPDVRQALVPNLILQPLVENAVRHGIAPRSSSGLIEVLARRENDKLHIEVSDNGPGISQNPGHATSEGVGLSNTRARLQQLYNSSCRFEIANKEEGGVRISFDIPFRMENNNEPS